MKITPKPEQSLLPKHDCEANACPAIGHNIDLSNYVSVEAYDRLKKSQAELVQLVKDLQAGKNNRREIVEPILARAEGK